MIFLVVKETNKILGRFDAWAENSVEDAIEYAKEKGYTPFADEVTFNGDMIIWCK